MSNYSCTNNHGGACMPQPQPYPQPNCCQPPYPQPNCCPQPNGYPQPAPCKDCPCGEDFRKALKLLCCPPLADAVNFNQFTFFTDYYVLGSALVPPSGCSRPSDNIGVPAATYTCGGDGCETITVSGALYPPAPCSDPLPSTVTQAALCNLKAVSFDAAGSGSEQEDNFHLISQTLSKMLQPCHRQECCPCLATALTNAAANRMTTIAAGSLVVENGTILGLIGNILVVSNSAANRFYFICANAIDFIG